MTQGGVDGGLTDELVRFWVTLGALTDDDARARAAEVTAVLRDRAGIVMGTCSFAAEPVPLLSDRRLLQYRAFLADEVTDEESDALFDAAFEVAAAARGDDDRRDALDLSLAIGVFTLVDAATWRRRPELIWQRSGLRHAGFLPDGRQLRVRFFPRSLVIEPMPGRLALPDTFEWHTVFPLDPKYTLRPYEPEDAPYVLALWAAHPGAVPDDIAASRVDETVVVATDEHGEVVGVITAFVKHAEWLQLDLLALRAFVARDHRRSNVYIHLGQVVRKELNDRYVSGADRRAVGILTEMEHEARAMMPTAVAIGSGISFVAVRSDGALVRAEYFDGAVLPDGVRVRVS